MGVSRWQREKRKPRKARRLRSTDIRRREARNKNQTRTHPRRPPPEKQKIVSRIRRPTPSRLLLLPPPPNKHHTARHASVCRRWPSQLISGQGAGCRGQERTCCTLCRAVRHCLGSPARTAASGRTTAPSTQRTRSSARTSAPLPSGSAPSSPRPPPRGTSPWPPCTTPSATRSSSASRSPGPTPGSPAGCFAPASSTLPPGWVPEFPIPHESFFRRVGFAMFASSHFF